MNLAIVGPGLIGRSVALATRRAAPGTNIVEVDKDDPLEGLGRADIVVIATPVAEILHLICTRADLLRGRVVVDTGSTKTAIVRAAREAGLERFVGGHPMAGAATSGASGARADLFENRPWFLVPHGGAADALARVREFVEQLGAHAVVLADDGTEHDRVMAAVSHLPQVVASILMSVAAESAGSGLGWAGSGLRDTTRLATSHASVWESILSTNAPALRPMLHQMADELRRVADTLDDGPAVVRDLFARARRARTRLDDLQGALSPATKQHER